MSTTPSPGAATTPARRPWHQYALGMIVLALLLAALSALDWDLSVLFDAGERAQAGRRMSGFLSAFGSPDLSRPTLLLGLKLSAETLSIAFWGTLLGMALGLALGLAASRAFSIESRPPARGVAARLKRLLQRALVEAARLLLDTLRGVPDFVWAILILTGPGPGPVTGILALSLSVGGILGKIYSELWDNVEPQRLEGALSAGSGRLGLFAYALQPRAARAMLSFTLMRAECAVRNASVIGVVGGGGLGGQMLEEFGYGNDRGALTLLLFLLALTGGADLLTNFFRHQLREDPNHPRAARDLSLSASRARRRWAWAGLLALALLSAAWLGSAFLRAAAELSKIEWAWIRHEFGKLLRPDLSSASVASALSSMRVPLALGWLGTLLGVTLAGCMAWPASVAFQLEPERFTGERVRGPRRAARALLLGLARALALVQRGIPEVGWVLLLAAFFKVGVLPGVLALGLHSAGVLARVFAESVDNLPYKRLEPAAHGGRFQAFLYAALPGVRREWLTYAFFQLESNVRTGVLLGILGLGGLGDRFHTSFVHWELRRASTYLIAMVLLTVVMDRTSRALKLSRLDER